MSRLLELLQAVDKKGVFTFDSTPSIGYPSGLLPLDYSNGYWVHVNNKGNDKIPARWLNIGTQGGTFYTIIGNSGVAKTTLAVQIGSAEILNFELGDFYHIDAEGTSNATRVQQLNQYSDAMMAQKYHWPDLIYVEDVFKMIYNLAQIKISNKEFSYHTEMYDQFGEEIVIPQPTVVLVDSLPSLQTKDVESSDELGSQTYNMRLAIAYNTFYKRLRPVIRDANITVIAINHLKEKPELSFVKTQAKIQYLKPNENIPGGSGPIYYSQNLLRMIYRGRFITEKYGFEGFMVEAMNLKSKTNRSGTSVKLVFHDDFGFEPMLTLMQLADDNELIKGRNPYCFFASDPDNKFNTKDISYRKDERIQKVLLEECRPILMSMVGDFNPEDAQANNPNSSWLNKVQDTYFKDEVKTAASRHNISNMYYGVHNFNSKHQPMIERFMQMDRLSENYKEVCIREMHTVPRIPETGEVAFRV